ncbi:Aste57867_18385 [Aphanomyces stellatus]|uniref:Aste57867_18385 protein n=1 Tax=Aphanomyces stellatus TaxID=120398 RepID=A0A485LAA3_9STRA|nr:hypothetical protein As57867_018323 [Aphanomyces stellatus]VFT95121.1 Aste57867_18385 [Aphanomyces stellatus]
MVPPLLPPEDSVHPLSLRLDRHPLDIFTCLWLKNSKTKAHGICIPDTILLSRGALQHWYFTSKTGEILRRKKDKTTKPKILRFFQETNRIGTQNQQPTAAIIVAVYVALVIEPTRHVLVVEHLTLAGVESLLNSTIAPAHAMLQAFVPPKSCYNNMVQTVFAHDGCSFLATRCSNSHMFANAQIPLELRAVTFERPASSTQKTISNPTTRATLQAVNRELIHHMAATVGMKVVRQVVHFKVGADDRLFFLWPSLIVFENQEAILPCQLIAPSILDTLAQPPPAVALPECPHCHNERLGGGGHITFLVTFKAVAAAHRLRLQQLASTTSKIENAPDVTQQSNNTPVALSVVPDAIRAAHASIGDDKYPSLLKDPSFLYRTVQVCEACCKDINTKSNLADFQAKVKPQSAPPKSAGGHPNIRWRSWKEPRAILGATTATPTKPQSARHLFRKPDPVFIKLTPQESVVVAPPPSTPSRRKSLPGPSLGLLTPHNTLRLSIPIHSGCVNILTIAADKVQASDKVEFVSKPRPVSAASTLLHPFQRAPFKTSSKLLLSVANKESNAHMSLASLRTAIKAATQSPNPSIRCLLIRHGLEPQHATVTIHELFTLCYNAKAPVNLQDLKSVALACDPRENVNLIDIDALDAMLLQSPLTVDPREERPQTKAMMPMRPKSCVSKPASSTRSIVAPKPPTYQAATTAKVKGGGVYPGSSRTLMMPSSSPPAKDMPTSSLAACSVDLTDDEAACLYQVLQGQ